MGCFPRAINRLFALRDFFCGDLVKFKFYNRTGWLIQLVKYITLLPL